MHPWILQPEPGTCPICGMDLTPVDPARFSGQVSIDPVTVQNIGIRTVTARRASLHSGMRTVGIVQADPGKTQAVTIRAPGWVERVHVDAIGDEVFAEQPLLAISSPALFAAQQDYLIAVQRNQPAAIAAAETRLRYLGFPGIEKFKKRQKAKEVVLFRAEHDGWVTQRTVQAGEAVTPNMAALEIADLSQVWVKATLYSHQQGILNIGDSATVRLANGTELTAHVHLVEPFIDPQTRSSEARFVVDNTGLELLPGAYVDVFVHAERDPQVIVPDEAVIYSGQRHIVFIAKPLGRFEPREVTLGERDTHGQREILSGIQPGERVVSSGQFLLDSESRMREALAKIMLGDVASLPATPVDDLGIQNAKLASTDDAPHLRRLIDESIAMSTVLYQDTSLNNEQRTSLKTALDQWLQHDAHAHHRYLSLEPLIGFANQLAEASEMERQRELFDVWNHQLKTVLQEIGRPDDRRPWFFHCGMAPTPKLGWWIQSDELPRNPFFGQQHGMKSCAVEAEQLP